MTEKALCPVQPYVPPGMASLGSKVANKEAMHDLCIPKDPTGLKTSARSCPGAAAMVGSGQAYSLSPVSELYFSHRVPLSEQETVTREKEQGPREQENWLGPQREPAAHLLRASKLSVD